MRRLVRIGAAAGVGYGIGLLIYRAETDTRPCGNSWGEPDGGRKSQPRPTQEPEPTT